jgi:hypothetical protein
MMACVEAETHGLIAYGAFLGRTSWTCLEREEWTVMDAEAAVDKNRPKMDRRNIYPNRIIVKA